MKNTFAIFLLLISLPIHAEKKSVNSTSYLPCIADKARQELRSKELQAIVNADQAERANWNHKSIEELQEVVKKDVERRKRVGEIFGEGCFLTAQDYAAAALVYQHGDTTDHFFQTFLWAKRAMELGDLNQKRLMALGIDRYLVSIGHKQLFASQAAKPDSSSKGCWCLQQIEISFSDKTRKETAGKSLTEALEWIKELNIENKSCPNIECGQQLKSTPQGMIPGYW